MAITHFSLRATKLQSFRAHMNMEGWKETEVSKAKSSKNKKFKFEKSSNTITLTANSDVELKVIGTASIIRSVAKHMGVAKGKIIYTTDQLQWTSTVKDDNTIEFCKIEGWNITRSITNESSSEDSNDSETILITNLLIEHKSNKFYRALVEDLGKITADDIIGVAKVVHARIENKPSIGGGDMGSSEDKSPITIEIPELQKQTPIYVTPQPVKSKNSKNQNTAIYIKIIFFIIAIPLFLSGLMHLINAFDYMIEWGSFIPRFAFIPLLKVIIPIYVYFKFIKKKK